MIEVIASCIMALLLGIWLVFFMKNPAEEMIKEAERREIIPI